MLINQAETAHLEYRVFPIPRKTFSALVVPTDLVYGVLGIREVAGGMINIEVSFVLPTEQIVISLDPLPTLVRKDN